jgi:PhnB protein
MASRLNPYLAFDGKAREALEFYRDVLGGTLTTTTYAEGGMEHDAADADKVMHGQLENESGYTLMASDAPSGQPAEPMANVQISTTPPTPS